MIPTYPPALILALLFAEADAWNIGNLSAQAVLVIVTWYIITKAMPKVEENHEKQLLGQRADLLALVQKERELSERIIQIFANSQNVTVKDNHEAILQLHEQAEDLKKAALEVLEHLQSDSGLREELLRTRARLAELEAKHGSNWTGRKPRNQPPDKE